MTTTEIIESLNRRDAIIRDAVSSSPVLASGLFWCYGCGGCRRVEPAKFMREGPPVCCGEQMSLDSPPGGDGT